MRFTPHHLKRTPLLFLVFLLLVTAGFAVQPQAQAQAQPVPTERGTFQIWMPKVQGTAADLVPADLKYSIRASNNSPAVLGEEFSYLPISAFGSTALETYAGVEYTLTLVPPPDIPGVQWEAPKFSASVPDSNIQISEDQQSAKLTVVTDTWLRLDLVLTANAAV